MQAAAAFDPSSSQKNRAQWINTGFAVADLTGAISDYVTVFRAGTQLTNSGYTQLLGGTFQIFTAAIGASDGIYKLTNWSYFRWTSTLSPLVLTSITASAATAFYTMAMAYT